MLAFFISYILSIFATSVIVEKLKYSYKPFPKLNLTKFGIKFFSNQRHRIKISDKIVKIGENVYLKCCNQIVAFQNIKNAVIKNEYLFFTANGEVKIIFNTGEYYKYFNLSVNTNGLDFSSLKQTAILDLINNNFEMQQARKFNKFLNFIKNTLNIKIDNDKVRVFANKLKISYELTYKANGKIKKINVKNTIGKN